MYNFKESELLNFGTLAAYLWQTVGLLAAA